MDLRRHTHADARDVRSLLLDVHDEAYADDPDPFHSRERFSYFVDLWSSRADWQCVSGWEEGRPVGYAYGSKLRPGGWWKGHRRPPGLRGSVFALSELMVIPTWRGTGRARRIHDALLASVSADMVSLLVDTGHPGVQALYERWHYSKEGEAKPSADSPLYAVMVRKL
ncbi:GNAT family N-acetyltransferase [Streptomyces sp. NPDC093109]|uniref:GNAT family N-acetyltransferase n=1 Tax=Streptomyces sp. NPDC093109 TaxID=3154977 RepID=UPI00344DBC02